MIAQSVVAEQRLTFRSRPPGEVLSIDSPNFGMPLASVANADLAASDAEALLEARCTFANVRGIRQALHRKRDAVPSYDPLLDPVFRKNLHLLGKYGSSFDLQYFPHQGAAVAALRWYASIRTCSSY